MYNSQCSIGLLCSCRLWPVVAEPVSQYLLSVLLPKLLSVFRRSCALRCQRSTNGNNNLDNVSPVWPVRYESISLASRLGRTDARYILARTVRYTPDFAFGDWLSDDKPKAKNRRKEINRTTERRKGESYSYWSFPPLVAVLHGMAPH